VTVAILRRHDIKKLKDVQDIYLTDKIVSISSSNVMENFD
jgi:hypothetical protein